MIKIFLCSGEISFRGGFIGFFFIGAVLNEF